MSAVQGILDKVQKESRKVYGALQAEIARMEAQLEALQDQMTRWRGALTGTARGARAGAAKTRPTRARRAARRSPSVEWDAIFKRLPKSFTMQDVAKKTPKLAKYPKARVMAVARWSRGKEIKKIGDGKYRKV